MSKTLLQFGNFEADTESRVLRREGKVVALTPREFATLQVLLERPGTIVSKEVLIDSIWKGQVVSEGNLARQIKNLREKLGPDGESLIRTFSRQGYSIESVIPVSVAVPDNKAVPAQAVNPVLPGPSAVRSTTGAMVLVVLVLSAVLFYWRSLPVDALIVRSVPLTKDGTPKRGPVLLGGGRIWFQELVDGEWKVASIPESGGDTVRLNLPFQEIQLFDVAPDGKVLLLGATDDGRTCAWVWSVSTGSARLVREGSGEAAWAPNNHTLATTDNNKLLIIDGEAVVGWGTFSLATYVVGPRWSPDGRHVAFDLADVKTGLHSIWQLDRDGKNAEPIRATTGSGKVQTHGRWTKDGRFFLYEAGTPEDHDLWAVRDPNDRFRPRSRALRMTRGPLNWTWPTPGAARKDIFAFGEQVSTELVYFDRKASTWRPYRASFPAYEVDFSRDGKWIAYTRYPEHTVWRAGIDGSEPVRLTSPSFEAHQPHWSPDGREIALMARTGADPWRIFTVPANGGRLSPLTGPLKDAEDQGVPTWSKDGRVIVYGDWLYSGRTSMKIHLFDRATSRISELEGSEDLWTPRWSPDGRYIGAFRRDSTGLMLSKRGLPVNWRQIVRGRSLDNMMWSPDSGYVYFTGTIDSARLTLFRVSIPGGVVEKLADIEDFPNPAERWFGVGPDGSPLGIRSVSRKEIYYLESSLR